MPDDDFTAADDSEEVPLEDEDLDPAGVPDRAAQALHSADFAASIRRAHNRGDDRPRPRPVPASQVAVASDARSAEADSARDEADPELSARAAAAPDGAEESDFAELDRPAAPASGIRAAVSFGRRLAAAAVDATVSGVVIAFFVLLGEVAWVASAGRVSPPLEALVLLYVLLGWFQAFVLDGLFGATLGKRLFGLRVFRSWGARAGAFTALSRRVVFDLVALFLVVLSFYAMLRRQGLVDGGSDRLPGAGDAFVFFTLLGCLLMFVFGLRQLDPRRRLPHDWLTRTVVVAAPTVAEPAGESVVTHVKPRPRLTGPPEPEVVPDFLRPPGEREADPVERPPRPRVVRDSGVGVSSPPPQPPGLFERLVARYGFAITDETPADAAAGSALAESLPAPLRWLDRLVSALVARFPRV